MPFYRKSIWFFVVEIKCLKHTLVQIPHGLLLTAPLSACLKPLCSKRPTWDFNANEPAKPPVSSTIFTPPWFEPCMACRRVWPWNVKNKWLQISICPLICDRNIIIVWSQSIFMVNCAQFLYFAVQIWGKTWMDFENAFPANMWWIAES